MNNSITKNEEARNISRQANADLKHVVAQGDFHKNDFSNFFGLAWEIGAGIRPASIKKKFGVTDPYSAITAEENILLAEAVKLIITVIEEGHSTYKDVKAVVLERVEQMREIFPQPVVS